MTRVKICCISSLVEAELAVRYGASAIGLVSEMPSGPGVIEESLIAEIARAAPPGVATFLLTCKQDADGIIAQQRRCGVNTLQLVDALEQGSYADLRAALPGVKVVQVIHVVDEAALLDAKRVATDVDAILLDSGNPGLKVKELGGTGRVHNWEVSRRIRAEVSCPVFLAGGLRPDNAAAAIDAVNPYALDICSGVRSHGALDEQKLSAFFQAVKGANA